MRKNYSKYLEKKKPAGKTESMRGIIYFTVGLVGAAKRALKDAELNADHVSRHFLDCEAARRFMQPGEPYIIGTNGEMFRVSDVEMHKAITYELLPSGLALHLVINDGVAVEFKTLKKQKGKNRWAIDIEPIDKIYEKK